MFVFQHGGFCSLHRRIVRFHRTRGANWFRSYCSVTEQPTVEQLTVYPLRWLCCEALKMEMDERGDGCVRVGAQDSVIKITNRRTRVEAMMKLIRAQQKNRHQDAMRRIPIARIQGL